MRRSMSVLAVLIVLNVLAGVRAADWSAGVARVNITPRVPIWMGGYAKRTEPAQGKLTDLWAKALAIDDGNSNRAILITADLIGVNREFGLNVRRQISKQLKLPVRPTCR